MIKKYNSTGIKILSRLDIVSRPIPPKNMLPEPISATITYETVLKTTSLLTWHPFLPIALTESP